MDTGQVSGWGLENCTVGAFGLESRRNGRLTNSGFNDVKNERREEMEKGRERNMKASEAESVLKKENIEVRTRLS